MMMQVGPTMVSGCCILLDDFMVSIVEFLLGDHPRLDHERIDGPSPEIVAVAPF